MEKVTFNSINGLEEIEKAHKVLSMYLQKLINEKKIINDADAWIEFLKMEEFKQCMFYEKWLDELKDTIMKLNVPVLFYEKFCCMYIEEAESLERLTFDIKPFLKFLTERNKYNNKNNINNNKNNINNMELEMIKERKKAHKVLSKYLKKITDSQKVINNIDNWNNFLNMEELEVCMFREKWLDELKKRIISLRIPVFFYERLYDMYRCRREEMNCLSFDINPFLDFLKEKIKLYSHYGLDDGFKEQKKSEMEEKHRTWLFKYYKIFNQKPSLNREEWNEFFKQDDFLQVQYYPKTMEMIATYCYTQDSYTQVLLEAIYDVYDFLNYSKERSTLYGSKYDFLYKTINSNL